MYIGHFRFNEQLPTSITTSLAIRLQVVATHVRRRVDGTAILPVPRATPCALERHRQDGTAAHDTLTGVLVAPRVIAALLISRVAIGTAYGPSGGGVGSGSRIGVGSWKCGRGWISWLGRGLIGGFT